VVFGKYLKLEDYMKKPLYVDHRDFENFRERRTMTALQPFGALASLAAGNSVQLVDRSNHACQEAKIESIDQSPVTGFCLVTFSTKQR